MTDLEDGFYWVRIGGLWTVAEKDTDVTTEAELWTLTGSIKTPFLSSDFSEIDPRRIVREGGETK